uniref:Uncharacterized protein n=1 Tax=Meloidogyne enterolobii TaxID=390850 RepID=A0A6V7TK65_MELEN|nr:unnamed protein product [Meloidogyne enterolobii]
MPLSCPTNNSATENSGFRFLMTNRLRSRIRMENKVDGPWIFGISWYRDKEWKKEHQRGSETRFFFVKKRDKALRCIFFNFYLFICK